MKIYFPAREVIFGLEDSLVSTLGVLVGIATGTEDRFLVIFSGVVIVVVESLSMSAGTYLSNKSEMELENRSVRIRTRRPLIESLYMGVFYILGGLISVLPFFFVPVSIAIFVSVALTVIVLFLIGYIKGSFAHTNKIKSGLEMSVVSLSAAGIGYLIGKIASPMISR